MKSTVFVFFSLLISTFFSACHSNTGNNTSSDSLAATGKKAGDVKSIHNPEFRKDVKKEAVAEYKERTDNRINDWYFSVRLFETDRTDNYAMKIQFEELKGEDTIRLPDLGTPPKPVIQKGKDKYSCIVGFMDNDNQFREYKLVYVTPKGQDLKIKTLKHYSVTENLTLVSQ
jgi:hypothetical protein